MRSCVNIQEGSDSDWTDPVGNGCAWYQEKRTTVPKICSTEEIRSKCPVACASKVPCFEAGASGPSTYSIWNRIMYLREESQGAGVLCVREGVDAVAECRKSLDVTTATTTQSHWKWPTISALNDNRHEFRDIKLNDCDVLKARIDPYCSFPAPWTENVKAEVTRNGGFTMEFWWKALPTTKIPDTIQNSDATMKRMLFLSSMSPPTVLASIEFSQDRPTWVVVYSTCDDKYEDINVFPPNGFQLQTGVWYRSAVSWGAPNIEGKVSHFVHVHVIVFLSCLRASISTCCRSRSFPHFAHAQISSLSFTHTHTHTHTHARTHAHTRTRTQRGLWSYFGSAGVYDFAEWSENWCFTDQGGGFIDAIQLPGDCRTDLSIIHMTVLGCVYSCSY